MCSAHTQWVVWGRYTWDGSLGGHLRMLPTLPVPEDPLLDSPEDRDLTSSAVLRTCDRTGAQILEILGVKRLLYGD